MKNIIWLILFCMLFCSVGYAQNTGKAEHVASSANDFGYVWKVIDDNVECYLWWNGIGASGMWCVEK